MKKIISLSLFAFLLNFNVFAEPPTTEKEIGVYGNNYLVGYLFSKEQTEKLIPKEVQDKLDFNIFPYFIPPSPLDNSPISKIDIEISNKLFDNKNPDWKLAVETNPFEGRHKKFIEIYSDIMKIDISQQKTPHLYTMIMRLGSDTFSMGQYAKRLAKERARPFIVFNKPTCSPKVDKTETHDSYPSGHSVDTWTVGLALSQVMPNKADKILETAYKLGQLRVICGRHWQSDVDAGRLLGSILFAQLQNNKTFKEQLELAKKEVNHK